MVIASSTLPLPCEDTGTKPALAQGANLGDGFLAFEPGYSQMGRKSTGNRSEQSLLVTGATANGRGCDRTTPTSATIMNLVTTMVGAGVLGFPATFARAGWYVAPVILVCAGLVNMEASLVIGRTLEIIEERGRAGAEYSFGCIPEKYEDIGEAAFGALGKGVISIITNLFMLFLCGAFMILIGASLEVLAVGMVDAVGLGGTHMSSLCFSYRVWVVIMTVAFVPLTMLNNMAFISRLSSVGVVASFVFILAVTYAGLLKADVHSSAYKRVPEHFIDMGVVISIMFLGFGSQPVLPTIRSEMIHQEEFPKAVITSMGFVGLIYMTIGAVGFYAWGNDVKGNVLMNMGTDGVPFAAGSILAVAIVANLLVTFPIIMNCAATALEFNLNIGFCRSFRLLLLACAMTVGLFCPYFLEFMSFVGSIFGTILCLAMPLACYWKLRLKHGSTVEWFECFKHGLLVVFGAVGFCFGTFQAIDDLYAATAKPETCSFWRVRIFGQPSWLAPC